MTIGKVQLEVSLQALSHGIILKGNSCFLDADSDA